MQLLWRGERPLILASKSETRHAMLRAAGIPHEVHPADIDERDIEQRSSATQAGELAALLAREKALRITARLPGALVLGADQTMEPQRFSKPPDRATAREQLLVLRARTHELHSAIAVARNSRVLFEHRESARLTMRPFSEEFLELYLDLVGSAATSSVGGYQIEGAGIHLFERIEGDHFVVLGLPLLALLQFLRQEGLLAA